MLPAYWGTLILDTSERPTEYKGNDNFALSLRGLSNPKP